MDNYKILKISMEYPNQAVFIIDASGDIVHLNKIAFESIINSIKVHKIRDVFNIFMNATVTDIFLGNKISHSIGMVSSEIIGCPFDHSNAQILIIPLSSQKNKDSFYAIVVLKVEHDFYRIKKRIASDWGKTISCLVKHEVLSAISDELNILIDEGLITSTKEKNADMQDVLILVSRLRSKFNFRLKRKDPSQFIVGKRA